MIELRLENTKEVFNDAVVITVTLSGHALPDTFVLEHPLIDFHLILPALIRMKDQLTIVRDLLKCILEHFGDLMEIWSLG